MTKVIYLTCIHDRHTDDAFVAFTTEKEAKKYLRRMQEKYRWQDAKENSQYGDWCLYISDDYYMSMEAISLVTKWVSE